MKLWLDDIRTPPDETWMWVRTISKAKQLLEAGGVELVSLDNDLGEGVPEGRKLVLWMAEYGHWPKTEVRVHSANSVALDYMLGMIERYSGMRRVPGTQVFRTPSGV